ncbi:MAG: type pilus assembly protein PilC, partial [Candidatus Hydrogenedentes bacterium]|nr:type pilus assembly protein PilC [Candidatus Hydrogenedentota bacterium]
ETGGDSRRLFRKGGLTLDELDLLNDQLARIARSGLPLASSLHELARDLKSRRLRAAIETLRQDLESGVSLADAAERQSNVFPPLYRNLLRAGERGGNLPGVLDQLCSYSAHMLELKHGLQEVLAYPVIVLVAVCVVLGFLVGVIVPEFEAFYAEFDAQLPWVTRALVWIGDATRQHGEILGGAALTLAFGAVLFAVALARRRGSSRELDWIGLRLPVLGRRSYAAALGRFSRSLGMLLANEAPAVDSLLLAASAADSATLAEAVTHAADLAEGGEPVAEALSRTGFFPPVYCWMLANAERTGQLDAGLLQAADDFDDEVRRRDKRILGVLGPATVFILGIIVGCVLLALYYPIYNVMGQIGV